MFEPITPGTLTGILAHVLHKRDEMPDDPELIVLAAALIAGRVRYQSGRDNPDENIMTFDLSTQQRLTLRSNWMPSPPMIARSSRDLIDFVKDWHDLAHDIADAFREAMRPNNPGKAFGPRYAAGRFVHAVIPLITGEEPSLSEVAQCLVDGRRIRKRRRPLTSLT
jgi:hypothetical protein